MAPKSSFRGAAFSGTPLPKRIERARNEGRFQHALELARQLYKHEPTEVHLELVRVVSFERGQQLQMQGHLKEAATIFANAADMGGLPEFQRQLVRKLAACGASAKALELANRLGDSGTLKLALGQTVDHALHQGPAGWALVPTGLQAEFDTVLQAFALTEAGQDDQARILLQTIGLQSPFLDWKVFLRGLVAYYAKDDGRALENWQRLDPQRLPARLAAPLRFQIDAAYRAAQPPASQNVLRQQLERLQSPGVVITLRALQPLLTRGDKLAQAFRQVEGMLPGLRKEAPDLLPRLAACFRWAIIHEGNPEDLDRYLRVFGPIPDDPNLDRINALALEHRYDWVPAHKAWQDYAKYISRHPNLWSGDQGRHVRALIWAHLGQLAADHALDEDSLEDMFPFAPPKRKGRNQFHPSAEECFRKSLELAPEVLGTHVALLQLFLKNNDPKKAIKSGRELLERFPDHLFTLQTLADLTLVENKLEDAQEYLRRAMQINPLDRELRFKLGKLHEARARELSSNKQFDQARQEWQTALALQDRPPRYPLLALGAMLELKAKNTQRYEELVAQAKEEAGHYLPVAFLLMTEGIRQKITPAQKKPLNSEFQTGLAQPLDVPLILKMLGLALWQRVGGIPYHGQKSHEKKILSLAEKKPITEYTEEHLENLCNILAELKSGKFLVQCYTRGQRKFPGNPAFWLIEAEYEINRDTAYYQGCNVDKALKKARKLIDALPRGSKQQQYMDRLLDLEKKHRDQGPPPSFFNDMFGQFMEGFGDFDDEDFEDEDDF